MTFVVAGTRLEDFHEVVAGREAQRLEGGTRHASTHAAGVVIAPKPIVEYAPLFAHPPEAIASLAERFRGYELRIESGGGDVLRVNNMTIADLEDDISIA